METFVLVVKGRMEAVTQWVVVELAQPPAQSFYDPWVRFLHVHVEVRVVVFMRLVMLSKMIKRECSKWRRSGKFG